MLFDTHAHLNDEKFDDDLEEVVSRALSKDVGKILVASYDMDSTRKALDIAHKYENIFCSVGIHPHQAKDYNESCAQELRQIIVNNRSKVVAIGETGLDFHYDFSPRDIQIEVFKKHIELAAAYNLPLIIHDRKAHDDCLAIVTEYAKKNLLPEAGGVFHCFSGDSNLALKLVELGFYISLAGPVTFKNSRHAGEVVENIPLERLLIETDCPYLSPEPLRGKRNEPSNVRFIASKIAEILKVPEEKIEKITYRNACRLYQV